jgi:hypothetical protein
MGAFQLIQRMQGTYATSKSFTEHGTIQEAEAENGITNQSYVHYHLEFVREHAFRLELRCERNRNLRPYSLVYFWADGKDWSIYNTVNPLYGQQHVKSGADESDVRGSGAALAYDLVPFMPALLCINDHFCSFRGTAGGSVAFNGIKQTETQEAAVARLDGKQVFLLTLKRDMAIYHETDCYWIDPDSFLILKTRSVELRQGEHSQVIIRETRHHPTKNASAHDIPSFDPPIARNNPADPGPSASLR